VTTTTTMMMHESLAPLLDRQIGARRQSTGSVYVYKSVPSTYVQDIIQNLFHKVCV